MDPNENPRRPSYEDLLRAVEKQRLLLKICETEMKAKVDAIREETERQRAEFERRLSAMQERFPSRRRLIGVHARRNRKRPPEAGLPVPAVPPKGPLPLQGGAEAPLDFRKD